MESSDGYAWTPILLPLDEPLNSWMSSHLKSHLDSSPISRVKANLWRLQVRDKILKEPHLVLSQPLTYPCNALSHSIYAK